MKNSHHMPMLEEDEAYVSAALDFLLDGTVTKEAKDELEKARAGGQL